MNGKGTPDWEASWWVVFVTDTIPCSCFSSRYFWTSSTEREGAGVSSCRIGTSSTSAGLSKLRKWLLSSLHLVDSSYRRSCCDSLFEFLPVLFAVVLALELSQIKRCDPTRLILCQSMPVVESFFVTGFETSFSPALVVLDEPVRDPRWPDFDFRVRRGILDAELDVGADNIVLLIQGITTGENLIPWGKVQVAGQFWASCSLLTSRKCDAWCWGAARTLNWWPVGIEPCDDLRVEWAWSTPVSAFRWSRLTSSRVGNWTTFCMTMNTFSCGTRVVSDFLSWLPCPAQWYHSHQYTLSRVWTLLSRSIPIQLATRVIHRCSADPFLRGLSSIFQLKRRGPASP